MKSIKLLVLLLLTSFTLSAQTPFYYYKGEKISLTQSSKKIVIKFIEGLDFEQKKQITESDFSLMPLDKLKSEIIPNISVIEIKDVATDEQIQEIIFRLNNNQNVISANPLFMYEDNTLQGVTDEFVVKLKFPSDYSELLRLANESNAKIVKQNQFDANVYTLQVNKNSKGNALEMANKFYEMGIFEFAEPNFLRINILQTNDSYYSDQWSIENTGQYSGIADADMDVNDAWAITMGQDLIKVAVVDQGVDLVHPDLVENILTGYDATGAGSNGAPSGDDAHGTACAGIIAAKANNGIGIAGVCPNCKIIPARAVFGHSSTDTWLANCINWAWQNGADVINNSWGGGSPSSQVTDAINNALTNGRDGLGCVILFSSGNDKDATPLGNSVNYPANLPGVVAVGAMSMCNERKQGDDPGGDPETSCDGEGWWASNYGNELSIVAPGVKISTTDISGSAGYNNDPTFQIYNNDYVKNFNGTSSSCPNAAGVCALILSVNRCLTQSEVKQILELSCDKVGSYCYSVISGHPNGTWNNQMGYGSVNALKAVQYAFSTQINSFPNTSGSDQGASSNFTWILSGGGCSQLAAATYIVKRHEVRTTISYPNTPAPVLIGGTNGFSAANPNSGNFYMDVVSLTSTSATVRTWVYEVVSTISGQPMSWAPINPSGIRFNLTVLSALSTDLFFQNQNVTGTETHNAMNKIEAGNNVTTSVPVGNYVIKTGANVSFHAGNLIKLSEGFITESGGIFSGSVDPFFTCTQYPMGLMANSDNNNGFLPVIQEYESIKLEDTIKVEQKNILIRNFPNPFTTTTTIEYQIIKSNSVIITLCDNWGRQLLELKNRSPQEAGIYQIKFDGINLPSGSYFYTLQTDGYVETKHMVKIE